MTYLEIAILCLLVIDLILFILVYGYVNTVNDRCAITDSQYQIIKKMVDLNNEHCDVLSEMLKNDNERFNVAFDYIHELERQIQELKGE